MFITTIIDNLMDMLYLNTELGRVFFISLMMIFLTVVFKVFEADNTLVFFILGFLFIISVGIGFLPMWYALLMFLLLLVFIYIKVWVRGV